MAVAWSVTGIGENLVELQRRILDDGAVGADEVGTEAGISRPHTEVEPSRR